MRRCLLAAVPDPSASLGFRFDETIDSIEGAARAYGYVLERWRLPASEPAENARPADTSKTISGRHDADEPKPKPADKAAEVAGGDPGLLVFRRAALDPEGGVRTHRLAAGLSDHRDADAGRQPPGPQSRP